MIFKPDQSFSPGENVRLHLARLTPHHVSNFKPQFSGIASYFDHTIKGHIIIDSDLKNIDTLFMKNGYKADAHDGILLENGHCILEAYDPQLIDMSGVVEGGDPYATETGLVIQELDEKRDLVFEWRSWFLRPDLIRQPIPLMLRIALNGIITFSV